MKITTDQGFSTPILLVAYNRPEKVRELLGVLRVLRPRALWIAIDGPKEDPKDQEKVAAVRTIIREEVSWECDLHLELRVSNLGCRRGMAAALDWFFSKNPAGIVLEDDLVPEMSFFAFCAELLERFKGDSRVWGIGGDNASGVAPKGKDSYGFTRYSRVWGWASWADRWARYDRDLHEWAPGKVSWLHGREKRYFSRVLDQIANRGQPDSWAFPLTATILMAGGVWVFPRKNSVKNTGFSESATHTKDPGSLLANVPTQALGSLSHPPLTHSSPQIDRAIFSKVFQPPLATQVVRKLQRIASFHSTN
jgi:hypothetical protein